MLAAQEAIKRLKEGNQRFVASINERQVGASQPFDLPQQQEPFAVILGCSDARVPAEIVFDQGPGDLFVIRVAGNIVAPSQLGSIEYATGQLGTRLVVVLGHSRCGAVQATLRALRDREHPPSPNLKSIVDFIRPALEPLVGQGHEGDEKTLIARAVRANTLRSVDTVTRNSQVIKKLMDNDGLMVVGAEYSLQSGQVRFLDDEDIHRAT